MQLFIVAPSSESNVKVIVWASGREDAKRKGRSWFAQHDYSGINPGNYIVTPITNPGDRVKIDITLNV